MLVLCERFNCQFYLYKISLSATLGVCYAVKLRQTLLKALVSSGWCQQHIRVWPPAAPSYVYNCQPGLEHPWHVLSPWTCKLLLCEGQELPSGGVEMSAWLLLPTALCHSWLQLILGGKQDLGKITTSTGSPPSFISAQQQPPPSQHKSLPLSTGRGRSSLLTF